jgi:hypothetical protein
LSTYSQKEAYNWFFGENAGITFNTFDLNPIALTSSAILAEEGCASISDANGKLLFYTNGEIIWNRNHSPMRNGSGLSGNNNATQSAIIIPKPNSTNIFYVITNDNDQGVNGCRYSEVDMNNDGGLGDVLTPKNKLIFSNPTEKLTAVRHSNGTDWWLIMHEWDSDVFRVYHVSATGISLNPVTSIGGSIHKGNLSNKKGQMKASQNGTKIALVIPNLASVELFDFDNSKGILQNEIMLKSSVFNDAYGVEFSSTGSYIYITKREIPSAILQFNLKTWTTSGILNTQSLIAESQDYRDFQSLQLAPDDKIYVARPNKLFLGRINNPDIAGKNCNYVDSAVYLGGKLSRQGLPNFFSKELIKLKLGANVNVCEGDTLFLKSTFIFGATYQWSGPDKFTSQLQNPFLIIKTETQSGYYFLSARVSGREYFDSIYITVHPSTKFSIISSGSTIICPGDSVVLYPNILDPGLNYNWSTGESTPKIIVKKPGKYSLTIVNQNGCKLTQDTLVQYVRFTTRILPQGSTEFCSGDSVILVATPLESNNFLQWSTGESKDRIVVKTSQQIILKIENANGCKDFDTVDIKVNDKLNASIESDLSLPFCEGDTVTLSTNYKGPKFNYKWTGGKISQSIRISQSGDYQVIVSYNNGCTDTAKIVAVFNPKPKIDILPNSSLTFCSGDSVILQALSDSQSKIIYRWSTGDTIQSITVKQKANYTVTATNESGCFDTTSILVNVLPSPKADILPDGSTNLCEGDALKLIASPIGSNYSIKWSNGATSDYIWVNATGRYGLEVTNQFGCKDSAELFIRFHPKPIPKIVSSGPLTICKGGGINLHTYQKYQTYKWSTGENSESILISDAGVYYVEVQDSNGCKNISPNITVSVNDVNISINDISNTKFGNNCIGSSKSKSIQISNYGNETVSIKSLTFPEKSAFGITANIIFPYFLSPNSSLPVEISFNPKFLKPYEDTLNIKIVSPCFFDYKINVSGTGVASARVFIPDTSLPVGSEYCIPVNFKLLCGDTLRNNLKIKTSLVIDASIFIPKKELPEYVKRTYVIGSKRYFDIEGNIELLTNRDSILFAICGTVLFGDYEWVVIELKEVIADNPYLSSSILGGELQTYGVCALEISHIQNSNLTRVQFLQNAEDGRINIELNTQEKGLFKCSVFDLEGRMIHNEEWFNNADKRLTKTFYLETTQGDGIYFYQILTPSRQFTKPILIYK